MTNMLDQNNRPFIQAHRVLRDHSFSAVSNKSHAFITDMSFKCFKCLSNTIWFRPQPFFTIATFTQYFLNLFIDANVYLIFIRNTWHWRIINALDHWFIPMACAAFQVDCTKLEVKVGITQPSAFRKPWEKSKPKMNFFSLVDEWAPVADPICHHYPVFISMFDTSGTPHPQLSHAMLMRESPSKL